MRERIKFTKEEKEEDIQLVLEYLKKGQSYSKIAEDLGRSIQYIANIKKVLIERGLITQEDIDFFSRANSTVSRFKEPVLQKFKEGKNIQEIATQLDISASTISIIRDLLIQEGLITLDEINYKLNKKVDERVSSKDKILQGLKAGKLGSQISAELRIPKTTISRIKGELISEGLISEQEISDLQNKTLNERNERILSKLKLGLTQAEIASQEGVSRALITQLKAKFINNGELSGVPVRRRQTNTTKTQNSKSSSSITNSSPENVDSSQLSEQEKQIIGLLLKGYPLPYISKIMGMEQFDVTDIINKLKKGKHITSSQINEARNKFKQNEEKSILTFLRRGFSQAEILQELTYLNTATLSRRVSALIASGKITQEQIDKYKYEAPQGEREIMQFVLSKLQLGFTVKEIIEADENDYLTERRVRNATEKLVQEGAISTFEIQKAKARRIAQKKAYDDSMCDNTIISLLKEGKTNQDIADEMGVSYEFVWGRVSQLKKSGKLSSKQLEKFEKRKKDNKYSDVYEKILNMLISGYSQQDIAKKLGKSNHFVTDRIQELKKDGRISDESMQKAKEDHKKREKQLRDNHKAAKSMLLEERIFNDSTSSNFVSTCREMFEANLLPLEDVPLLRKVIEFTSITQHSINFMLRVYVSFKQYDEAIKFLNSCIGYLTEDPDLIELARKSKSAIRHCQKQQQAVDLLKNGVPIEYVSRKVGLTESEVVTLNKKYTDSDDSPPITFGGIEIEI